MANAIGVDLPVKVGVSDSGQPGRFGNGLRRLRLAQIRGVSALAREASRLPLAAAVLSRVRHRPVAKNAIDLLAGYNRVFADLPAARAVAEACGENGHDSPENGNALRDLMEKTRPSDYPVLFHLARLPLMQMRVFDLGGTMGNLFYLYDRHIHFPEGLRWTVHDLPGHMARGQDLARRRSESRIGFTGDVQGASGHDLLLISGSLHYFDFSLAEYVARLDRRPEHVLVNRTPLVDAPEAATVQYTHGTMVACKLLNRADLIAGMTGQGYELVDSWSAPEFSIRLPYDPDYWVKEYSGMYFRAKR
jgi:putative methyltransferase (TIGR04325 family)